MTDDGTPRRSRVPRLLLWGWAILAVPLAWPTLRDLQVRLDGFEASLVVVSDTRLLDMQVTYDGKAARPWPASTFIRGGQPFDLLYPRLVSYGRLPRLVVTWRTAFGPGRAEVEVEQDNDPICLYVLRLDAQGVPVIRSTNPAYLHSAPFEVAGCGRR